MEDAEVLLNMNVSTRKVIGEEVAVVLGVSRYRNERDTNNHRKVL